MKTVRPFTLCAAVGALLVSASSTPAQTAVHTDTSGHLTAPFDLGDNNVTGTLDAARLPHDAAFRTLNVSSQALFTGPLSLPANQPITLANNDISGSILTVGGGVFTPQTLPAGHSIRRNSANTAFEDYTPNTGDGSALTNLNASALSTGTVSPARLGTGTPSSATVLTGAGWAGTASTGNTIASTGNVLMGDSAGNAVAVSSGADLLRVFQTRLEGLAAAGAAPANILLDKAQTFNVTGVSNADGTFTIPANGRIQWQVYPADPATNAATHYAYVCATTDLPRGALKLEAFYGGYGAVPMTNPVTSVPVPGAVGLSFTNAANYSNYVVFVSNTTAVPLTIYLPFLGLSDPGLQFLQSYADHIPVAPQPVADLDFTRFASSDRSARYQLEQRTTAAADSVNGSAGNAGTLYAPKLSLPTTVTNPGGVIGLYRGSLFRGSLPLSAPGTTHGIVVQDVALGSVKALPVVSALDPVLNSGIVNNGDGTYSYQWTPAETLANNGYANVYVVEVNTATEAVTPIASRRRLLDVTSSSAVVATPGTVYVTSFGGGWLAQWHPSDGLAPGSGSYRYEVVSRVQPANWGAPYNLGDGAMSGVVLVGSSSGYGSLGGPTGFVGDRLAFVHATTHNAVFGGGSLQRSVFYESGATTGTAGPAIQLAVYTPDPTGLRWNLNHCLFYANVGDRLANCLIAHSAGNNFERGDLSDCAFVGARWTNGSLQGRAIDYVNVATGVIERVYVQAIQEAFGYSLPVSAEVRSSVFRQVNKARIGGNFHDNIVLAESASDPNNVNARAPVTCLLQQNGARVVNNLLWSRGLPSGVANDDGAQFLSYYAGVTTATVQGNIVVLNPASTTNAPYYAQIPSETGGVLDYNLVINLAKGGFIANKAGTNYLSWAAYQAGTGLDAHSFYVDLSTDPRGLQAVFVDPINGDFRWAQTEVARRCAAFCKANNIGPATVTSHWPVVPPVDDALRMIIDL